MIYLLSCVCKGVGVGVVVVVGLSVCIVGSMVHVREGACTQRQEKNLIQTQVSMLAELLSTQLSPHTLAILAAVKTKIGSNAHGLRCTQFLVI